MNPAAKAAFERLRDAANRDTAGMGETMCAQGCICVTRGDLIVLLAHVEIEREKKGE